MNHLYRHLANQIEKILKLNLKILEFSQKDLSINSNLEAWEKLIKIKSIQTQKASRLLRIIKLSPSVTTFEHHHRGPLATYSGEELLAPKITSTLTTNNLLKKIEYSLSRVFSLDREIHQSAMKIVEQTGQQIQHLQNEKKLIKTYHSKVLS